MLPSDKSSPNSVVQLHGTPIDNSKEHAQLDSDEMLTYAHYINTMKNEDGSLLRHDTNHGPSASALVSSDEMDLYLSPGQTKDYYGPNMIKQYCHYATGPGRDTSIDSVSHSAADSSMSNLTLSDLYSSRDEFAILHSDMRPSEAPWLYAVNKMKAKEILTELDRKKSTASSSSILSTRKSVSPRFNIISKRTVPHLNEQKSVQRGSGSNNGTDNNSGCNTSGHDGIDHETPSRNSMYIVFKNSCVKKKGGLITVLVLTLITITVALLMRHSFTSTKSSMTPSPHTQKVSVNSTSRFFSIGSMLTRPHASADPSFASSSPKDQRSKISAEQLKSRRKERSIKSMIKGTVSKFSGKVVSLSLKFSKFYVKAFMFTVCLSQVVMFLSGKVFL